MDKLLSANTIKNVFYALGAKTSDSNYAVALLNKTSGAPAGFMDMSNLASVLGGLKVSDGAYTHGVLSYLLDGDKGVQTIQNASSSTVTIPADQRQNRCAIFIVGCNTKVPSIFMLSRDAVWDTVFEGNAISASDVTINADDSITVTKPANLSLYYRMIVMEW